jgi:hypothetical protein
MIALNEPERDLYKTLIHGGFDGFRLRNCQPVNIKKVNKLLLTGLHAKIDQMIAKIIEGVKNYNRKKRIDQFVIQVDELHMESLKGALTSIHSFKQEMNGMI